MFFGDIHMISYGISYGISGDPRQAPKRSFRTGLRRVPAQLRRRDVEPGRRAAASPCHELWCALRRRAAEIHGVYGMDQMMDQMIDIFFVCVFFFSHMLMLFFFACKSEEGESIIRTIYF